MRLIGLALILSASVPALAWTFQGEPVAAPPPVTAPFSINIITSKIPSGYQVIAADLNKDGRTDLVSLGLKAEELIWYENPGWVPHVITTIKTTPDMVVMDAADVDRDGVPEIALAYGFNANPTLSVGNVGILHSGADPREPWTVREVDKVPATHRVIFADVRGNGQQALIGAPILADKATGFPDPERHATPLYAYMPNDWKRGLITDENRGVVHGLSRYDWYGDGREDPMTAGYSGVFVHSLGGDGKWSRLRIAQGDPAEWPNGGASDVVAAKLAGKTFFVTIEPFHGSKVVVYTQDQAGRYQGNIIDDGLQNGHVLMLVDVDNDGIPEIVAGGNRNKANLYFYKATDATGQKWTKALMDDDIAPVSCVAADIETDGTRNDVVCMDSRPPNYLKWYKYTGAVK